MKTLCLVLSALALLGGACSGSADAPGEGIEGRWDGGDDWGEVVIDSDLGGTYSSTSGLDLGVIELTETSAGSYSGTWAEATARFGTLELELVGGRVLGVWVADPESSRSGSSGGDVRWERE